AVVGGRRTLDVRVDAGGAGQRTVLHLTETGRPPPGLGRLGLATPMRKKVRNLARRGQGLFVVCGPAGAGKSTTLHARLAALDRYQKNVFVIEETAECRVPNVTHLTLERAAGKSFAAGVREALREGGDVVGVGEVRDREAAEAACEAARAGRMVFAALPAGDAVAAVVRLLDLGVA